MRPLLIRSLLAAVILLGACFLQPVVAEPALGLTVGPGAIIQRDGRPYRGMGLNYFDCFLRTLQNGDDHSYDDGFRILAENRIPFVRFAACGYWPKEMRLYLENPSEYFRRLDRVVKSAQTHGIGLIASLFWHFATVPDLVGERMDQWGQPASKTLEFMRNYVRDIVSRYAKSPAIWGWELGNEFSLQAQLPNAKDHRPAVVPALGTASERTDRDDTTYAMMRVAFREFAQEVRKSDPNRVIGTGDSFPRLSAWHQETEGSWKHDSTEQFAEMLAKANPDPVSIISLHAYEDDDQRFAAALAVARKLNKPIFIGEFGAPGESPEAEAKIRRLFRAMDAAGVPLAALWVFDYKQQKDFNVTADNARSWQLRMLREWNEQHSQTGK